MPGGVEALHAMTEKQPSSRDIIYFLNCRDKRALKKHARSVTIYQDHFAGLALMASIGQLPPYHYARHHAEIIPEDIHWTPEELEAFGKSKVGPLSDGRAIKFASKVDQVFKVRKLLNAHLFYTPDHSLWHIFCYDSKELRDQGNHWKEGSHLHYISFLWPEYNLAEAWGRVQRGDLNFSGKLHVRFRKLSTDYSLR